MKKKGSKKKASFKAGSKGKKKASTKKTPAKKTPAKKAKRAAPAPRPPRGGASCQFVCSECYAEFILPANFSEETLSCPECLHVGKRPDEDFLRTVLIHKGQEKKWLAITAGVAGLFFVVVLMLIWQTSPYVTTASISPMVFLGTGGVLLIALLALLTWYEANRWEVYF